MKNTKTINGKLNIINRLNGSINGNPRFLVEIDNQYFKTTPDAMLAYAIENHDGKHVRAVVGRHYGQASVESIINL